MNELEGFDVVVVGAGTAGLPTTLSALGHGLRVLVLEKEDRIGGTLWITGASYSAAGTRLQKQKGIEDSPEAHFEDANAIGHGYADQDLLRLATDHAAAGVNWLEELGADFGDSPRLGPEHELYGVARTHYQTPVHSMTDVPHPLSAGGTTDGTGVGMLRVMRAHIQTYVNSGQVMMLRRHHVKDLLVEEGRVVGVEVERPDGSRIEVRAPAVVLATGGYAANRDLLRRFVPQSEDVLTMTNPSSQGDGLLMAERIGAKITHTEYFNPGVGGIEDASNPGTVMLWVLINTGRPAIQTGDIWVNKEGSRFVREEHPSHDFKEKTLLKEPGMTMYSIYDDRMRLPENPTLRQWIIEVESRDIDEFNIKKADTVEVLAAKIGCDPATLRQTIDRYNEAVDRGKDDQFGRESLTHKIEQPPFYALRSRPHLLLTRGGIKIDTDLKVVDADENVIEGLFAVGEVIGNGRLSGDASVGGMAVGPCFTFGRLLGELLPGYVEALRAKEKVATR